VSPRGIRREPGRLHPHLPVQRSELDRLRDVIRRHRPRPRQVRNRPPHFQDPIIRPRAQPQVVHGKLQQLHRRHEHELRRKGHRTRRPGDGHPPFLQRLPQRLQNVPLELRQLVQEQHAMMRQRNLTRRGIDVAPVVCRSACEGKPQNKPLLSEVGAKAPEDDANNVQFLRTACE
jgi:hypothetical protein